MLQDSFDLTQIKKGGLCHGNKWELHSSLFKDSHPITMSISLIKGLIGLEMGQGLSRNLLQHSDSEVIK